MEWVGIGIYIYIYIDGLINIHTLSVRSKLSSKLLENEIKISLSDKYLCQINLLKLHENILKCNRSNLFKEITIDFNNLQMTSKSLASLNCLN